MEENNTTVKPRITKRTGTRGVGIKKKQQPIVEKNITQSSNQVNRVVEDFKPFLSPIGLSVIAKFPSNDIQFTHFLIFALLFLHNLNVSVDNLDFYSIFSHYKHLPFHSFLIHFKTSGGFNIEL